MSENTSSDLETRCASGRHAWLDPEDAKKCCNGWRRVLRYGEPTEEDMQNGRPRRVMELRDVPCWYVWVPDDEEARDG